MSNIFKLSVSKSSTFTSCKAKYKFAYILKLPQKEYSFHLFGRFVHRILELFHLDYLNKVNEPYKIVMSKSFNTALEEMGSKLTQPQKDEAITICKSYLKQLNEYAKNIDKIISVEQTFNLPINDGLVLTGMIDRVQLDKDGIYHILDYKTSKSSKYLKNDLLQLLTYAYVIYNEHPEIKKVRVSYIMLRLNCEIITKEFELEEILSIKDTYEKYAEEIHKETEFAPNPQILCAYCSFADVCEAGQKVIRNNYKIGQTKW